MGRKCQVGHAAAAVAEAIAEAITSAIEATFGDDRPKLMAEPGRVLVAEQNTGLYRRELERLLTGTRVEGLNRLDGRPISPRDLLEAAG